MTPTRLASRLPRPLRDHVLFFEGLIERTLARFADSLPACARVLDAGAGEARHRTLFANQRYVAVDLCVGDSAWNYSHLDVVCDLCALPFRDGAFDAAINVVTLEHICDPARALGEMGRMLNPGGRIFLAVPQDWEVHQAPHDYFRYTRFGLEHLLTQAGFEVLRIEAAGGYFRLLSRRLLNGIQFFMGGWRWVLFIPAAACLGPPALLLPLFEPLDPKKNFTLGYICEAQRLPSSPSAPPCGARPGTSAASARSNTPGKP